MPYYLSLNPDGFIVGACHSELPPPGEAVEVDGPPPHDAVFPYKTRYVNGEYVRTAEPWIPVTYVQERVAAYPPVGDQLDMLWHAMNRGEIPRVEPFYSQIKEVKDTYPKQANNT